LIGITLAVVGMCASFLTAPHHLALSLIAIALGVAVIWALYVFDEKTSAASPTMLD
jgi:ABC-type polar amino acid transport system ATPase subunit